MTEVLVDSYFWLGAINSRNPYHAQILQTPKPPRGVTTDAVLLEVMDALSSPRVRETAAQFWKHIHADSDLVIVRLDEKLLNRAVAIYEQHRDKAWSLTDCTSFVVMKDRGIAEALTADHHFEQAGFTIRFK
jgi:predicted nucleic acid-binding protein